MNVRPIDANVLSDLIETKGKEFGVTVANRCTFRTILTYAPTLDYVPRQQWISVKDRLPEESQRVIACGLRGGIFICRFDGCFDGEAIGKLDESSRARVFTHWMPLPEARKEE